MNKDTGKTLLALSVIAVALALCSTTSGNVAGTIEQWAPIPQATAQIALDRSEQETQVTATYLSVLSSEVLTDTRQAHALTRKKEDANYLRSEKLAWVINGVLSMSVWVAFFGGSVIVLGVSIGAAGVATGLGARAYKWGRLLELPDKASLVALPRGQWRQIEPRAGGQNRNATQDQATNPESAQAVREFQAIVVRAIADAVVEAVKPKLLPPGKG